MNFYEKAKNQQLYNKATLISYNTNYVYFMKNPKNLVDSNENWYKQYSNTDQVDREVLNVLEDKTLELDDFVLNHQSTTIFYIILEIHNKYSG